MAWWYRQYAREQSPVDRNLYEAAETAARTARAGLSVPPSEVRHGAKMPMRPASAPSGCPCETGAELCTGPKWQILHRCRREEALQPPYEPGAIRQGARISASTPPALRRSVADRGESVSHTDSGRAALRAHIRVAHSFWRGPLEGEPSRRVRWLPPILVNADEPDNLPVTVRPVSNP